MPEFGEPKLGFNYRYRVQNEIDRLRAHFRERQVPRKRRNQLIVGSWNIANLGAQDRTPNDLKLCAEILRPYDLIAVQEIRDNYDDFERIVRHLGPRYEFIFTDRAGNDERLAFIYDAKKVAERSLKGELVVLPRERKSLTFNVRGKKVKEKFPGFNRNPYMASFQAGKFSFTLVNVHIYYGASSGAKLRRRVLEIYTLASWAHVRVTREKENVYDPDIILLGDMNVPTRKKGDRVFSRLKKFGMQETLHASAVGSNLQGTKTYDQITFLPSETRRFAGSSNVFDFDNALFPSLWNRLERKFARIRDEEERKKKKTKLFREYMRFHISDHRPIWAVFNTQ